MKKFIAIAALCIAQAATIMAQDAPWSLDQCVDYAIAHNIDVARSRLSAYQGELSVTEAKDRFLPNLSGYAGQSFNFGRGLTADNTYANRNTSSFSVGAQLSLPLFQGTTAIKRLKYSRTALAALLEDVEAAKDDVTLNVISQYLQAVYASEMLAVARENLAISRAELERRNTLLEAGKIPELDIYEARSQVSNDELSVVNAENDSIIALLDLAQMLNLPADQPFAVAPLADESLPLMSPEEVFANALASNHAMRAADIRVDAAAKNVALAKAAYIPTISFSAGLGTNYYKTSGYQNDSFGPQMRHNFAKSIGFNLSVPIFDAFGTRNNVRRARAEQVSAALQLDDSRNRLYKAINQAYTQAIGAGKKLESGRVAVQSARAAFEAMQVKYDNGKANATEYEKALSTYTTARLQELQAKYESILRIRILNFYNK